MQGMGPFISSRKRELKTGGPGAEPFKVWERQSSAEDTEKAQRVTWEESQVNVGVKESPLFQEEGCG